MEAGATLKRATHREELGRNRHCVRDRWPKRLRGRNRRWVQPNKQAQPGTTAVDEPPIAASGCIYSEPNSPDPDYEWSGCFKLYNVDASDQNAWYGAGFGTAHGWGTGIVGGGKELQKGSSQISWSGELTYQVPLCNDGWNVTWDRTAHEVEWHGGVAGGPNDSVSAAGASTVRLPWSTPTVYMSYRIGWGYICFC